MGQTRYYNLAFFDFGDRLDTRINVQKEIDRFVVIDKQLYGLYSVFGNGVIEGWTVRDAGFQEGLGISISIAEGIGVINYMASETALPGSVYGLPPNSIIDIYATLSGTTSLDRIINFIYSTITLSGNDSIRLARVSTGASDILYIDNTVRDLIGFEQIIDDAINSHQHRGTPSKIDLEEEVKNQLPGARIEGIDASKVVTGQFDIDRIPLIDHNNLENNGLLTHAALDSFVRTMSQNNKELLGEITSVNLLRSIIFWKYNYANVDQYFINELALIPGVSPDSFIDFAASTANISLPDQCISGVPAQSGIFTSVYWNNTYSFNTANLTNNVLIENDSVSLDRSSEITESIADFSDNIIGFTPETLIIDDSTQAAVTVEEGNRIGRLGGGATFNYFYRKNLTEAKNWDGTYDELVIKVKTSEEIHRPVYMYVVNGSNVNSDGQFGSIEVGDIEGTKKPSTSWTLLAQDESMSSFEEKSFDISNLGLTEVTQIAIYTDDDFIFDIDDIEVRKTNLLAESGTIRFRYSTEASVVFHSIFYNADVPDGTSLSVRVKTASSSDLLSRSAYSFPLSSGGVIASTGTNTEIEIVMTSDDGRALSPTLNSLELRILVSADFTGFVIDTEVEWDRGTPSNISVEDSVEAGKSHLTISTPINVGGRYFAKGGSVSEMNDNNIGVYGFSGNLMPVSPNQAREWSAYSSRGFSRVSSVIRKFNNNFLVADTNNNRVLEVDSIGNLVRGFGSTYSTDSTFYPLSAVYNNVTKVLALVFTKSAVVSDITKIAFYIGSSKLSLTVDDTVINSNKAGNKVLEIQLDDDTSVRLVGITSDLSVNFDAGAFTEDITISAGMTTIGNSIFSALRGITCFIGDFTYIDNISHPIFINETSEDNWIIANSSVHYVVDSNSETANVPDVIEIDPTDSADTDSKISSSDIKFSDYSLGGIYEYEDGRFIISGIEQSTSTLTGISGSDLIGEYGGAASAPAGVLFRASAIDALKNYIGKVVILDKINNKTQVLYVSPDGLYPSDVDGYSNGDMIISESSFADASGRLIRLDSYGNITWNYGSGTFNIINDTKVLNDDSLIVSV